MSYFYSYKLIHEHEEKVLKFLESEDMEAVGTLVELGCKEDLLEGYIADFDLGCKEDLLEGNVADIDYSNLHMHHSHKLRNNRKFLNNGFCRYYMNILLFS